MFKFSTIHRISFALSLLAVSLLLLAHWLGLLPDWQKLRQEEARSHRAICETIALHCCIAAERNDTASMEALANLVLARNETVNAIIVRRSSGQVLAHAARRPAVKDGRAQTSSGSPAKEVAPQTSAGSPAADVLTVPIFAGRKPWGEVQVSWAAPQEYLIWSSGGRLVLLVLFVGLAAFVGFSIYLRRVLTHLDPTNVVPERVKTTLDTLAEGVVVLDDHRRVVLANEAFANAVGKSMQSLCGARVSDLQWTRAESACEQDFPWERAFEQGVAQRGEILRIDLGQGPPRTFSVNASPIMGKNRVCRGVLATFDDMTQLEKKTATLVDLVQRLQDSYRQIEVHNEELQYLATRDSLTGCFNRRAFFSQAESAWDDAQVEHQPLVIVMADIDRFKTFNDKYGHAVGDKVLKHVARVLQAAVRKQDLVCRFGGEEFCILVKQADLPLAQELAERMRAALEATPCDGLKVTSSFGVAALADDTPLLHDAIEQADRALYASKRAGRNFVTTWSELVQRGETDLKPQRNDQDDAARTAPAPVSLKAVNTLFNSLWHRDRATAEHSRRVANLCMVFGQQFMQERDLYILEAAALLHDVGKLGVPDAVLLKPGPLTSDEWKVMAQHDDISRDLVDIVFACPELSEIVATHHAWFGGNPREPSLPTGHFIPLGARILSITDAYDAIISDRVYHRGRTHDEAIIELRRCAGMQFDPELVGRFIETLNQHVSSQTPSPPADSPQDDSSQQRPETDSALVHTRVATDDELALSALSLAQELAEMCQLPEVGVPPVPRARTSASEAMTK